MSWLPPRPEQPALGGLKPWLPAAVRRRHAQLARSGALSYVVVDELDELVAGLIVSPWPTVDDHGRVRFAEEDADVHLGVPLATLESLLHERRVVNTRRRVDENVLRERAVRIGDVFAAQLALRSSELDGEHVDIEEDPGAWFEGAMLDITAQGLELARMQASAAAAGAVDERFLDHVAAELGGEEPPDAGPPAAPDRTPPRGSAPTTPVAAPGSADDASTARRRANPRVARKPVSDAERRAEIRRRIRAFAKNRQVVISDDPSPPPRPKGSGAAGSGT